ncbi:MFS transporter [Corynebacterium pseudokroppenstedtii]|uniref:Putative proline/betaine transporter n=1 Tax=Corynebacterium pseudokroppenstedtii TaxID=2804917 RepID=A0AAU0Q0D8_9CORY|nr:MFS transporter [Corynebacterium pseudokroppenstedtii]MBY0791103.1 MFS transporter [Corynebacterium pseudokroppenstedtii]MCF6793348.1 MFS transporter [Corynebacterium pseudokroppenstedtii]MCF8703025.1 MFS transporter [Corynebacterium pseudokroppenstedtii]MCG2636376.1 MFS transporter [Corynebacterium pseudokroppenstedtii]
MSVPTTAPKFSTAKALQKNTIAGAIGVLVHWFDWAIYAYLASTISHVFFPEQSDTAALLSVFAIFAVAFFVRPLGSVIFGHIGDTLGRKRTLSLVIIMMAAGTLLIGLLPSYSTIGIWSPILLVAARIIQGIAAGGEFGSAAAFLAEYSPRHRRGFGTSWIEFGSVLGFLLASLVVAGMHMTITTDQTTAWGWRIPFLLTVPLAAIGLWIRLKIEDTPEFQVLQDQDAVPDAPIKEVFRQNGKQFFQTIGIEIFMNCTFYVVMVYLLTYQETVAGIDSGVASTLSTVASLIAILLIPLSGIFSDRIGRKPILFTAGILLLVVAFPLFSLMKSSAVAHSLLATLGLAAPLALILGTHSATVSELFPTRTRQSGLSIAYSIAGAFFAGTLPYINTWLIYVTGNDMIPAYTLMVVAMIGLITVATIPETKGIALLHASDLKKAKSPSTQKTDLNGQRDPRLT